MQDEVNTKVVAIMIKGGKISAEVLKKALDKFVQEIEKAQKQIFKNFLSSASCARQDFHWRISARFFTSRAQHHFICINS